MEALLRYPFLFFLPHRIFFIYNYFTPLTLLTSLCLTGSNLPAGSITQTVPEDNTSISCSGLPAGSFLLMVILFGCVPSNPTVVMPETGSFYITIFSFLLLSLSSEILHITCGATSPTGCDLRNGSVQCTVTDPYHVGVFSGML